jgi:hypothetical protein
MEKYNGWTNYETWRVNLEIFDGMEPTNFGDGNDSVYELSASLKYYAEDLIEQTSNEGLARDYAMAFLDAVNWREIAQHMINDYAEEVAE